MLLSHKKKYLQVALNGTLADAQRIIASLPVSDRIIVEAGTPFIKRYGANGIAQVKSWYGARVAGQVAALPAITAKSRFGQVLVGLLQSQYQAAQRKGQTLPLPFEPYVVADLKTMDRGGTEVMMAKQAGANAAVALGLAPTETLDSFIAECRAMGVDAMVDMMNVPYPIAVLRTLKLQPDVVVLHRGVDETEFNKEKMLPFHEIQRIKANYTMMIAVAGGDTIREVQRAIFNDADIVVVWKSFYAASGETGQLAQQFLDEIR
ncbi:MAG: hypothetical protein PHI63_03475 [Patescibacteria group bacterium]|nr:hypothetical protein [Patescibacteria group bacterium]